MGLREDALAAAGSARTARVAGAREALGRVLTPAPVEALTVAEEAVEVVVFTDGVGLFLAVDDDDTPRVSLVTGEPGEWTDRGAVASLAELGLMLDGDN